MNDEQDDTTAAGGFDLDALFGMASGMLAAQQAAAEQTVVGSAGGGAVQVTVTGAGEFVAVQLAPEAVDPADIPMLEDLVLAALRDAMDRVQALQSGALGGLGGVDLDALGGLGGLLGGGLPGGGPDGGDRPS